MMSPGLASRERERENQRERERKREKTRERSRIVVNDDISFPTNLFSLPFHDKHDECHDHGWPAKPSWRVISNAKSTAKKNSPEKLVAQVGDVWHLLMCPFSACTTYLCLYAEANIIR